MDLSYHGFVCSPRFARWPAAQTRVNCCSFGRGQDACRSSFGTWQQTLRELFVNARRRRNNQASAMVAIRKQTVNSARARACVCVIHCTYSLVLKISTLFGRLVTIVSSHTGSYCISISKYDLLYLCSAFKRGTVVASAYPYLLYPVSKYL